MKILSGTLDASIFENTGAGVPAKLTHRLRIELEPPDWSTKLEMELDSIAHPGIRSWKDLEETSYDFPVNPEAGYFDGSTYLHGAHIYVDVTSIHFGKRTGRSLYLRIDATVNFEASGIDGIENITDSHEGVIEIGNLRILECLFPGLDKARAHSLLTEYSDPENYSGPVKGRDYYDFSPKI